jgi:hypothetical protein
MFERLSIISAQTSRADINAKTVEEPVLENGRVRIPDLFAAFQLFSGTVHNSVQEVGCRNNWDITLKNCDIDWNGCVRVKVLMTSHLIFMTCIAMQQYTVFLCI